MKPILPGATIGILGSGQLGRMLALEARRMGYKVHTFSPDKNSPTGQIADVEFIGKYDDINAALQFAEAVDVVTFEFENISGDVVKAIEAAVPVHPSSNVLHITQHRLREKNFLDSNGFPVTPFAKIATLEELKNALSKLGTPAVLKTAGFGYDGKGQSKINSVSEAETAYSAIGWGEAILEAFIDFQCEVSVVAARGTDGSFAPFEVVQNIHSNHILDTTIAPAAIDAQIKKKAIDIAKNVMESLDCVGVLCIEMFVTKNGELIINELAPRPHNSGHWTIDACVTNQFEQQLRAVCGLPLGSAEQLRPAAMVNLLGDIWANGEPDWAEALRDPNVKLHLYGKSKARKARKMGHATVTGNTAENVAHSVKHLKQIFGIVSKDK